MDNASGLVPPIDLGRYPIGGRDEAATQELIARCRQELEGRQFCSLPGFIERGAIAAAAAEAKALLDRANPAQSLRNCYLQREGTPSLGPDHPRNIFNAASYRMIAADLFDQASALKRLYYWQPFQGFVAAIVGEDRLYPNEDLLQPVNVICYSDGDQSAWHYDSTNAFTMTLMLQAADQGGDFELAANTRNGEDDEDIPTMQEVPNGGRARVVTVSREPGELTIFRGCNSLHRVSPVAGDTLRMMAVFVYENEPRIRGDPEVNMTVYGRSGREEV